MGHFITMKLNPHQRAFTQIPTCTLLLIVCAVQLGKTHKTKTLTINEDNERLQ